MLLCTYIYDRICKGRKINKKIKKNFAKQKYKLYGMLVLLKELFFSASTSMHNTSHDAYAKQMFQHKNVYKYFLRNKKKIWYIHTYLRSQKSILLNFLPFQFLINDTAFTAHIYKIYT